MSHYLPKKLPDKKELIISSNTGGVMFKGNLKFYGGEVRGRQCITGLIHRDKQFCLPFRFKDNVDHHHLPSLWGSLWAFQKAQNFEIWSPSPFKVFYSPAFSLWGYLHLLCSVCIRPVALLQTSRQNIPSVWGHPATQISSPMHQLRASSSSQQETSLPNEREAVCVSRRWSGWASGLNATDQSVSIRNVQYCGGGEFTAGRKSHVRIFLYGRIGQCPLDWQMMKFRKKTVGFAMSDLLLYLISERNKTFVRGCVFLW